MNSTRYIATLALLLACGDTATAQTTRGFLAVNGGLLSGSKEVRQAQTFDDVLFGPEQGRFDSTYPAGGGTAFDISGGVTVWRQLAFGAGVSLFSRQDDLQVTAQLPHSFHFDQLRRITGTAQGLTREETAVHVQAMWVAPVGQRVEIAVFGGPSFVSVTQDMATGITFTQVYPYDTAGFTGIQRRMLSESAIGFHVGADVGIYFTRWIGVGGAIRFTRAIIDMDAVEVEAGGLLTSAGLRVRF